MTRTAIALTAAALGALVASSHAQISPEETKRLIADIDTAFQAATERNDAEAIAHVLHPNMILVLGNGVVRTGDELVRQAHEQTTVYERQVEEPGTQTVRLYGDDTAIVTALLWLKGVRKSGEAIDYKLWFSDTYVRTETGWKYAFGQASLPLPGK